MHMKILSIAAALLLVAACASEEKEVACCNIRNESCSKTKHCKSSVKEFCTLVVCHCDIHYSHLWFFCEDVLSSALFRARQEED